MSLQNLFYIIIFFISLVALIIGCIAFTKKKGEYFKEEATGSSITTPAPLELDAEMSAIAEAEVLQCGRDTDKSGNPLWPPRWHCEWGCGGLCKKNGAPNPCSFPNPFKTACASISIDPCGDPPNAEGEILLQLPDWMSGASKAVKFGPYKLDDSIKFPIPKFQKTFTAGIGRWKKNIVLQGMANGTIAKKHDKNNNHFIEIDFQGDVCADVSGSIAAGRYCGKTLVDSSLIKAGCSAVPGCKLPEVPHTLFSYKIPMSWCNAPPPTPSPSPPPTPPPSPPPSPPPTPPP